MTRTKSVLAALLVAILAPVANAQADAELLRKIHALKVAMAEMQAQLNEIEKLAMARSVTATPSPAESQGNVAEPVPGSSPKHPRPFVPPPSAWETTSGTRSTAIVETSRTQCTATTRKGTRCSRLAQPGRDRCWQH